MDDFQTSEEMSIKHKKSKTQSIITEQPDKINIGSSSLEHNEEIIILEDYQSTSKQPCVSGTSNSASLLSDNITFKEEELILLRVQLEKVH